MFANIQNCAAGATPIADAAGWGNTIQALGRRFFDSSWGIGIKCAECAKQYLGIAWQGTKSTGAWTWDKLTILASSAARLTAQLCTKLFNGACSAGRGALGALCYLKDAMMHVAAGALRLAGQFFNLLKDATFATGRGCLQGLQWTKGFASAHPVALLTSAAILTAGGIGFALYRLSTNAAPAAVADPSAENQPPVTQTDAPATV